jgi:hypothetical protein
VPARWSLKRLQIADEVSDLIGIQPKFRHTRMTGRHSLDKRIFKRFDGILLVKRPKWRRFAAGASETLSIE